MEQHPVPQAITTYKFKLVGDMTLKQFLELAAGIVLAWLLFSSPTNVLIKWTFGPLLAFIGFALAFIPIEDRPLDQWIVNFFKALYSPTQFIYKPRPKKLNIFAPVKIKPPEQTQAQTARPARLDEYLQTLPPSKTSAFDTAEKNYLKHVNNLFGVLGLPSAKTLQDETQDTPPIKPSIKGIRVRKLTHPKMCLLPHATIFQSPPQPKLASMPATKPIQLKQAPTKSSTANAVDQKNPSNLKGANAPHPANAGPKATAKPKAPANNLAANAAKSAKPISKLQGANAPQPIKPKPVSSPVFAQDVVLPQSPDKPNLIAGITLDKQNKIVPNVILEVKNNKNQPVRALKSNKLGQFFIATPLDDGIYHLAADHPDHRFAIIKLEAKGETIPPLKIQAI